MGLGSTLLYTKAPIPYIMSNEDAMAGLITGIIIVVMIVLFPIAIIWALNTLLGLGIPINIWTWLAVVVLLVALGTVKVNAKAS